MRKIEVYRCFSDHTWDTAFVEILADTPDLLIETTATNVARQLWAELIAVGVYHIPPSEDDGMNVDCQDCNNCDSCMGCERCCACAGCNDCLDCDRCKHCDECLYCENCVRCDTSYKCTNCTDCMNCSGLVEKTGWVNNKQCE